MFSAGFSKLAKKSDKKEDASSAATKGTAGVVGGALAIKASDPYITGRTSLYHGTTEENAEKILREGLRPKKKGAVGITDMLDKKLKADSYAYMDPVKAHARGYADQAVRMEEFFKKSPNIKGKPNNRQGSAMEFALSRDRHKSWSPSVVNLGLGKGKVVKARVPLWKREIKENMVRNPELANFKGPLGHILGRGLDVPTFKDGVDPEYFVKSPHYKGQTLKELGEYAAKHPGRFASGIGLAGAGVAGTVYGAKKLYDAIKSHSEKPTKRKRG